MATFDYPLTRREWLRAAAVGVGALGGSRSGWLGQLAAATGKANKSVVVLWLGGGPSTIDLWDLKPGHPNGGPFREIATTAPGLKIGECLPKVAALGKELVVIRSMSSKEGDHGRASSYLRTGYAAQGPIHYPALGSLIARKNGSESVDIPNYISISPGRFVGELDGGFLGPLYAPLVIGERPPEGADYAGATALTVPDLAPSAGVSTAARDARLDMLAALEGRFEAGRASSVAAAIRAANGRAARLMRPQAAAAFRLDDEKPATRAAYGPGIFGQGCLLARRLVERGVSFVEVSLDGWDTHNNNFERVRTLCGSLDAAFAALLTDLKSSGLLESTLVVCMGEFGRTPKINGGQGRDHHPRAWSVVLAGCGIKGGQPVGQTDKSGESVEGRPSSVPDLIATVCKAVGINPTKQNPSNVGRPIRVADPDARPIEGVL